MTLLDSAFAGLGHAFELTTLAYIVIGSLFGLVIGVIPGLSGHFAMAIVLTFLFTMDPRPGVAFLIAAHATVAQGGGLTAILFSIPGTGQNAATLLDGPKMRDKGEAGIAIGAAMTSCFLGACFGVLVLAALIPILREVVLFFGPGEIFMLAVLGLIFVAVLGQRDLMRALIAGLLGLFLALVGTDNGTSAARFSLGSDALLDGLSIVPVVLGLFAMAEMIALWHRGGALTPKATDGRAQQKQLFQGVKAAFRHWWLVIRCSTIGTTMGIIPGLGSSAASFAAYGHARNGSKTPEAFETGTVEGVIAPEAANDAVEGGALASTVAFGIPGSSSMAILLAGLTILGLETGPQMLSSDADILFLMMFAIIIGNFIGTLAGMALARPLMRASMVPARIMVPVVTALIVSGAYAYSNALLDVWIVLGFGALGYLCSMLRYSRAAFLIGFVLGQPIEYNLFIALQLDGPAFVFEPIVLGLACLCVLFLGFNIRSIIKGRVKSVESPTQKRPPEAIADPAVSHLRLRIELAFLIVLGALTVMALVETWTTNRWSPIIPSVVLLPLAVLIALQVLRLVRMFKTVQPAQTSPLLQDLRRSRFALLLPALVVLPLGITLFGYPIALCAFAAAVFLAGPPSGLRRVGACRSAGDRGHASGV